MDKLDLLVGILGVASYIAIMMDLRSYEQKVEHYEAVQEKRRNYTQRLEEKKRAEKLQKAAEEKKAAKALEAKQVAGMVEKLGAIEDAEIMRKSKVTSGKLDL